MSKKENEIDRLKFSSLVLSLNCLIGGDQQLSRSDDTKALRITSSLSRSLNLSPHDVLSSLSTSEFGMRFIGMMLHFKRELDASMQLTQQIRMERLVFGIKQSIRQINT